MVQVNIYIFFEWNIKNCFIKENMTMGLRILGYGIVNNTLEMCCAESYRLEHFYCSLLVNG